MLILNIHGYHGSQKNSAYTALKELGCDLISPPIDYDETSPENILGRLRYILADRRPDVIVGTSLGGFFAAVLSAEHDLPAILVNPCLMPFYHLPKLGFEGDVIDFIAPFGSLSELDKSLISCIVGDADEVLGDHSFTEMLTRNSRFRRVPNGKHSGASLPLAEYFDEVLRYYRDKLPQKELAQMTFPDLLE